MGDFHASNLKMLFRKDMAEVFSEMFHGDVVNMEIDSNACNLLGDGPFPPLFSRLL